MNCNAHAAVNEINPMQLTGLRISASEVHMWAVGLDRSADSVARLTATLSTDESMRATRFMRLRDRERFTVARGMLRTILGAYADRSPGDLRFVYGPYGKPALAPDQKLALTFNVAHSGALALYGIAIGRRIGVDVEQVRTDFDDVAIARRFFSPQENEALQSLATAIRLRMFYTIWTSKEAYVKAQGEQLSVGLAGVVIACALGGSPRLLAVPGGPGEVMRWDLRTVDPAPGYKGALVVEGHVGALVWHRAMP